MIKKTIAAALITLLVSFPVWAQDVELKPDHPKTYVVVKGDTLWDISSTFLRDPWLWPEIWHVNTQIENPHLIFPGDLLTLVYIDGKPRLQLTRGGDGKLSPRIREVPLDQAIPAIPLDAIQQFLSRPRAVDKGVLETAPYVVAIEEKKVMAGSGDKVYVRKLPDSSLKGQVVFRKGDPYIDPDTKEVLGYEAIYVGDSTVVAHADPATVLINSTEIECLAGDRLLPSEERVLATNYVPRAPDRQVEGRIISVYKGVRVIGQFNIVAINLGEDDGMKEGTVLAVYRKGETVKDKFSGEWNEKVQLPDVRAGELMVFRTFKEMSFGLIMRAERDMAVLDIVKNP